MNRIALNEKRRVLLDQLLAEEGIVTPTRIGRRRTETCPPLSFAQQRLWFLSRLNPSSAAYNVPLSLRLPGPLNVPVLEKALNEVVRRHEVLRTTFELRNGEPVQVILAELRVPLTVIDLRSTPVNWRAEAVRQLASEDAMRPFDLSVGPLMRNRLIQLADGEHMLLLTLHHIIADAWSLDVLSREVTALYQAFAGGQVSPLMELPIQYGDFAVWQREWLKGERLESQLQYWREQLRGFSQLDLRIDRARSDAARSRGAMHRLSIPRDLSAALRSLAQAENVTLFMLLLSIFKVLLHRYSGQEEIVLGTPIAGRVRPELEPLIGFFVNSLVLRTSLAGHPSFREVLRRVRGVALGAYAHQDVPFERVVEALQPERDLDRNPFFQVMFQVNAGSSVETDRSKEVPDKATDVLLETAKFDLSFSLWDHQETIEGTLEYEAELFDADTMARFATHFVSIAASVVQSPERAIDRLDFLEPSERNRLLVEWNCTAKPYSRDHRLHKLIEEQIDRSPKAIAIQAGAESLTYAELEVLSNRLARFLVNFGIGPDRTVGICMERSLDFIVAIVAILKAGGAYLPLDPDYPAERLTYMLTNSAAAVVLTNGALIREISQSNIPVFHLHRDRAAIESLSSVRLDHEVSSDQLAYLIYTSGSTGRPHGVMVPHRAISNHMHWMIEQFELSRRDAVLQKTPISFDASVWEILAPLISGGRLILAQHRGHQESRYLTWAVRHYQVTVLQLVPSQLEQLVEQPGLKKCKSLRLVFCGGESLLPALCERFTQRHQAELYNLYGPTEACIDATFARCTEVRSNGRVFIGRPINNMRAYVLDRNGEVSPLGVPGVLHLSGAGLARGYWNEPTLTAERFVPDPFSAELGARMYCTGDMVRYRKQGELEFLGRVDHQVKLRGYRIELTEIERVLETHPAIEQAVLTVNNEVGSERRLVAYIVCRTAEPCDAELRGYLRRWLPNYMMPACIIPLREIPRTPNGKVDRRGLPKPEKILGLHRSEVTPIEEPIEQQIAAIWRTVLSVTSIGLHDNFFDLGGHSLLLVRVHQQLQTQLECEIPLLDLFRYPSVQLLAGRIRSVLDAGAREPPPEAEDPIRSDGNPARFAMMQAPPLFRRTGSQVRTDS